MECAKFQCTARITSVLYNAASNELVRTNTITKGTIVQVDTAPFKKMIAEREASGKPVTLCPQVKEFFAQNKLYARVAARPGQVGAADGYILEGKELAFYSRKILERKR
eukprot:GHVH01006344.1.p1 GENE.GHVH01006344.1~~GHVH01006344.1.p1  ORF type:complete len:109 (+),score=19.61 GHVH01006344.1:318-644(+)